MRSNPYDRRGRRDAGGPYEGWAPLGGIPRPDLTLNLEDLDAMARSVADRAYQRGRARSDAARLEQERHVRRQVWDEGHVAGQGDGRLEILRTIDEDFGERVRTMLDDTRRMVAGLGGREIKPEEALLLRERCGSMADLLLDLIEAQHRGFEKLPF